MSIGGNPAVAGSVALGNTVDEVLYNGSECDKVILDGVVVWERNYTLSGTATYSPIQRRVNYEVTLGDLTSWSYRAVKNGGGGDTGEIAVSSGTTTESGELGVSEDGAWTVTFKGFKNGVEKATATATVTVATPFIEITSVEELGGGSASPPSSPPATPSDFTATITATNQPTDTDFETTLNWSAVSGATEYRLEYGSLPDGAGNPYSPDNSQFSGWTQLAVNGTTYSKTLGQGSYWWRVSAKNAAGYSSVTAPVNILFATQGDPHDDD